MAIVVDRPIVDSPFDDPTRHDRPGGTAALADVLTVPMATQA
jgi:hypothetical protein